MSFKSADCNKRNCAKLMSFSEVVSFYLLFHGVNGQERELFQDNL